MNLAKRKLAFLTTVTAILLVTGMNFSGFVQAKAPVQNSPADAGDTTQAKIARAISAGPTEIANLADHWAADHPQGDWRLHHVGRLALRSSACDGTALMIASAKPACDEVVVPNPGVLEG